MKVALIYIVMFMLLVFNYLTNFLCPGNASFSGYQENSEALALDMASAKFYHVGEKEYGLGMWMDCVGYVLGGLDSYREDREHFFITDENYKNGYSREGDQIAISFNPYTQVTFIPENQVRFADGTIKKIKRVENNTATLYIEFDKGSNLSEQKNGNLYDADVFDCDGNQLLQGDILEYRSQYGLQGKIISWFADDDILDMKALSNMVHAVCSILLAVVVLLLVSQIAKGYNSLMAGTFYIVFLLSPWIVNFARNYYWLEFLWFIPMLIGLYFANNISNRGKRITCYLLVFMAILIKSLCGYEYISSIMLGALLFPIAILIKKMGQSFFSWDCHHIVYWLVTPPLTGWLVYTSGSAA